MGDPGTPCRCEFRSKGLMMSMVPFASFTFGGNWVINADALKTIAPIVTVQRCRRSLTPETSPATRRCISTTAQDVGHNLVNRMVPPFNLHSVIQHQIAPGQFLSRRQTCSSCLLSQEMKVAEILNVVTSLLLRLTRSMFSAWKRFQDAVFWVDIDLASEKGLTFDQTRLNAIKQGTLPAHCIERVESLKNGEKLHERQHLSPRPPPKISLKHDHDWIEENDQLGSTVER